MGLKRTSCFMVLVLLLFAWASTSSVQEDIYKDQVLIKQLINPLSEKFDHALVEEFLFNCKLDLINPRTIRLLSPQAKQSYLNYLRRSKKLSPVSGEEKFASKSWFSKYFEAIYRSDDEAPQGRRRLQTLLKAGAPVPGPAFGSPNPSPGPVFFLSPPTPIPDSPATPFFPPSNNENSSSSPGSSNSNGAAASGLHKSRSSKNSVAIAVSVTASVTFFVVVLLFLCCGGYCGPGSKLRRNGERPLLSLSLTDFSLGGRGAGGASPQFYQFGNGKGNPSKDDRGNHHNLSNHHSMTSNSIVYPSSPQSTVSSASTVNFYHLKPPTASKPLEQMTNPPLKPPPGWALTSPAGLPPPARPPLRPPPGQAEPLPLEPRSSFKPPSTTRNDPPLPTPFVPPAVANAGPPPPPPARPPPPAPRGSPPPPPPASRAPPPRPPSLPSGSKPPPQKQSSNALPGGGANNNNSSEDESDAPKAKLKPFFWDKVMANPDQSMVWHQIKSGSFQFDENMIESLFGTGATEKSKNEQKKKESSSQDPAPQFIQIIDAKKSQNLAILLRALNVTIEEVCDALLEGNELPAEFVQNLLKMTPTADEELKLRLFSGDPSQLGTAERFLKVLVDIPFAFKRLEALLFMSTLTEEVAMVKESFQTLEVACKELRNSRLFLKLLEAVLKTGNRMNDGTFRGQAQAFKLDTLLKLSDVRGTDGKTTLLLFVVREIIRSEGDRAARISGDDLLVDESLGLAAVSGLADELGNVKKASVLDAEGLTGTVARLGQSLLKTRNFLKKEALGADGGFGPRLEGFVGAAEAVIVGLLEEEKRIMTLVRSTGDYFHGNSGKDEGLRLFVIVRDFLVMVDKACREVRDASKARPVRRPKKETSSSPDLPQLGAGEPPRMSPFDLREKLFPAIADRRVVDSSSDDDA